MDLGVIMMVVGKKLGESEFKSWVRGLRIVDILGPRWDMKNDSYAGAFRRAN